MPRARTEKGGADLRKLPIIAIRKLGSHGVSGFAYHPHFSELRRLVCAIEIDKDTHGRARLEVVLHEAAHVAFPGLPESVVRPLARYQAMIAWAMGYRADEDEMDENFAGEAPYKLARLDE